MRLLLLAVTAIWTLASRAQQDRLSFGLNATLPGSGQLGLGGGFEFQHRLAPRLELLSEISLFRTVDVSRPDERNILGFKSATYGFLGAGLGYRSSAELRGAHFGLLAGALLNPKIRFGEPNRMNLLPAVGLNVGHSIGERGDLSGNFIIGRGTDRTYPGYFTLRFSYLLLGKK